MSHILINPNIRLAWQSMTNRINTPPSINKIFPECTIIIMLINFWSQVTLVGEIMEHREIFVRWKWKGRNSCVVLSSVVSVTFYEVWTPMITWVYPIERQRLQVKWTYWFSTQWFRFTLEMEPPFKAERVFFTLPLKNNSASCSNKGPNMSWDRGGTPPIFGYRWASLRVWNPDPV